MKYLRKFNESVKGDIFNDERFSKLLSFYNMKLLPNDGYSQHKIFDIIISAGVDDVFYNIDDSESVTSIKIMCNSFSNYSDDSFSDLDDNPTMYELNKDIINFVEYLKSKGHEAHFQKDSNGAVTYFEICIEK